ncbi:TPA: hypothetical protein N0F65_008797, partial [Lagenidium giganteum]
LMAEPEMEEGQQPPAPRQRADNVAPFDYHISFNVMTSRRLMRRYRGTYKQYSMAQQMLTAALLIYILTVVTVLAFNADAEKARTSKQLFSLVVAFVCLYAAVRVALIVRWVVYWIVLAIMFLYAITGKLEAVFWWRQELTDKDVSRCQIVLIVLAVIEFLTITAHVFTHSVYPHLVGTNKLTSETTDAWWRIKRSKHIANAITYQSRARFYRRDRDVVRYCGGLDNDHRPHGFGMWTDTAFHGERLTGHWCHGVPVGPFRSFEHGSGYCFVNLRVGYCHIRGEQKNDEIWFFPKHATNGLNWGVASVECSVSGGFFKFLPKVSHLTDETKGNVPRNATECFDSLRTKTDNVVYKEQVKAHKVETQTSKRTIFKEQSMPFVAPSLATGREALVLLHGYNCSLDYGINRLGQLLALGDFPPTIHPFVFSWPSGGVLAYFQAKKVGAESDLSGQYFHDFLRSLMDAGYTSINIIAHSMGARVYFNCLNRGLLDDVFSLAHHAPVPGKARLETLTFCNPDYERNDFVRHGGAYDRSRRYCHRITLYADSLDGALYYCEIFTKESLCGPLNYSLGKRGYMMHRDKGDEPPVLEDSPTTEDLEAAMASSPGPNWQQRVMAGVLSVDEAIGNVNTEGQFDGVAACAYNYRLDPDEANAKRLRKRHHHREYFEDENANFEYLDMDVVDTTWMDQNVHAIRHNYFNINPTVVDDLRHLIVDKKRAVSRPGLFRTNGNVFIFLVAPSVVKNK